MEAIIGPGCASAYNPATNAFARRDALSWTPSDERADHAARPPATASFVTLVFLVVGIVAAFALGVIVSRARMRRGDPAPVPPADPPPGFDAEAATLREELVARDAELVQTREFARERESLYAALAQAKAETARYRQYVVDLENNAPPPLLGGPGAPDDLKLIVGVGPILERMLYQIGITTYRQIARWTERDIDEIDARLPEFPGRIRRDAWVTQARALYQSKYGEPVPPRDRP